MIKEIQNCSCDNLTTYTLEMLEKNGGHSVGARGFKGVHLLQSHSNFQCHKRSGQLFIHRHSHFWLDSIQNRGKVIWFA